MAAAGTAAGGGWWWGRCLSLCVWEGAGLRAGEDVVSAVQRVGSSSTGPGRPYGATSGVGRVVRRGSLVLPTGTAPYATVGGDPGIVGSFQNQPGMFP